MLRSILVLAGAAVAALAVTVAGAPPAALRPRRRSSFPVTVVASNGKVTVDEAAEPASSRCLRRRPRRSFAIGAGLAGGRGRRPVRLSEERTARRRSRASRRTSRRSPAYRPDLVVIAYDPKGLSGALGRLGITVLHQDGAKSFKGAYQQIRQLGLVTGRDAGREARRQRHEGADREDRRATRSKAAQGLSVYHELDPDLFSATSKTFVGQVYTALGLRNIADAADSAGFGYPQLSAEYVVSASPDLIVLADTVCCGQKASTVAARPGWDRISAVRTGSIVRIDDSIASRWGPRSWTSSARCRRRSPGFASSA